MDSSGTSCIIVRLLPEALFPPVGPLTRPIGRDMAVEGGFGDVKRFADIGNRGVRVLHQLPCHGDLFKRLKMMQDVDAIIADSAAMIEQYGLHRDAVRDVVLQDLLSEQSLPLDRAAYRPETV